MTFDLDAVANEETAAPFPFTFGGEQYELPPSVDVIAASLLQRGDLDGALRRMLGQDQWERMANAKAVFDGKKLVALLDAYGKHVGISMGESGGSTGS